MSLATLVLAFQLGDPLPPPALPRATESTPSLVADWAGDELESGLAVLVNPFAQEDLTATAKLEASPIPDDMTVTIPNVLAVDVDAEGEVVRVFRVLVPGCEEEAVRCEIFDVIARNVSKWEFRPGKKAGRKVATRSLVDVKIEIDLDDVEIERLRVGPVDPAILPPPAVDPLPKLEAILADRLARGATTDVPPGMVPVESLDEVPLPPSRSFDIPTRALAVAGDLLLHVTEAGNVDQILALEIQPRIMWPFWQQAVSKWRFQPAKIGDRKVGSWVRVLMDQGRLKLTGDVRQVATIKRNLPVFPTGS